MQWRVLKIPGCNRHEHSGVEQQGGKRHLRKCSQQKNYNMQAVLVRKLNGYCGWFDG